MIITIETNIKIVPKKWAIVKLSPRIKEANIADAIGVGANMVVAFDTSKKDNVKYQHINPDP